MTRNPSSRAPAQPTSVRLPPDLKRDLEAEAAVRRWSISQMIVEILRYWQAYAAKRKEVARPPVTYDVPGEDK